MAEQNFQQTSSDQPSNNPSTGSKSGAEATQGMGQAANAGRESKDKKAADFAQSSGEKLKEGASQLTDAASDAAAQAKDKISEKVSEQKSAGAAYIDNLAEAMRRASREFDQELPIAGKYIRKAAGQVEYVADSIRAGDLNDLLGGAKSFARRQPVAFLGLATLAGFAAVRFLKSDSARSSADYRGYRESRCPTEFRANPRPSGADYVG